jgi:LruC domain-containing protein
MQSCQTLLKIAVPLALAAATLPTQAASWEYFGEFQSNGVPKNMIDLSGAMPPGLLNEIYKRLPESLDVRKNDAKLITDDLGANIQLLEDAEITVAFVNEGAGYTNSVGFFAFDPANKPKTVGDVKTRVMFPNFSLPMMKYGNAVSLGKFKAGTGVGFSILANAWNGKAVNPAQPDSMTYFSMKGLNPEAAGTANLNAHTVLLSKPEDSLLVLGFEDLTRTWSGCDHDFNDAIIAIKVTPFSAVDRSQIQSLTKVVKDTDKDGVPDDLDAFPTDPERAARRFYPSATGYGSLAFEDNWPRKGDFDMNDLVVGYRTVEILNARNEIVDVQLNYQITARGAQNDNAFAVHLPGVAREAVDPLSSTLKINDLAPVALAPESGQKEAVFILTGSSKTLTATGLKWPCDFFNTVDKCPRQAPVPMVANIHFKQPLAKGALGSAPYNPFIYPNRYAGRGREVHLVDHPPTDKADRALFGSSDDASTPASGRYYRTATNQPFALDIPETWRHPAEWNSIDKAYLNFNPWAEGILNTSTSRWYLTDIKEGLVFKP